MVKFFFLLALCFNFLFCEEEKWSVESVKVGEIVVYELNHPNISSSSIEFPKIGLYPPDSELPIFEIVDIQQKENQLQIKVRFLEAGEHSLPVSWKVGDIEKKSEKKIPVLSNLTGSEYDIDDILEPILFNGPLLLKLLFVLFLALSLAGLLAYLILKWKKKPTLVREAKYQTLNQTTTKVNYFNKLEKLLEQEEILHKEFAFLLSEFVKEELSRKLKKDIQGYTNKELLDLIQKNQKINNLERMRLENYLNIIKYMPNQEVISNLEARKIYKTWMELIEI